MSVRTIAAWVWGVVVVLAQNSADNSDAAPRRLLDCEASDLRRSEIPSGPPLRIAERGTEPRGWRVLGLSETVDLVRQGAGFVRLRREELEWMNSGSSELELRRELREVALGAGPLSACLAVDDVLSRDWQAALSADAFGAEGSPRALLAEHALVDGGPGQLQMAVATLRPRAGFLCNAWVVHGNMWDASRASKYELQELWSQALAGQRVLVVMGEGAPAAEDLAPTLHRVSFAAARHITSKAVSRGFPDLIQDIRLQAATDINMVLIMGLTPGLGALLAAGLDCVVQAIDAGPFSVLPRALPKPGVSQLSSICHGGSCRTSVEPWGGSDFHPRPQLLRRAAGWINLNGPWEVHIGHVSDVGFPDQFGDGLLEVPFPIESNRGGVGLRVTEREVLWLRRHVKIPAKWPRALVHLDACDWECSVYVNRKFIGVHRGGYDPFSFDATPALTSFEDSHHAEILIKAWDPSDAGCEYVAVPPAHCVKCCTAGWQPRGKQSLQPGFIMYSAVTGPWQTVWLEEGLQSCTIQSAAAELLDGNLVRISIRLETAPCAVGTKLVAMIGLGSQEVARGEGDGPFSVDFRVSELQLWSPDKPVLYSALLSLCSPGVDGCGDTVQLKFGLRRLSTSPEDDLGPSGERELLLNGKRLFQHGVLHQGYWPESLLTPPSAAALAEDVEGIKASGFNLVRVHAVVMPALFYFLCDQLGLLVWQDFPGGDGRALPLWDHDRSAVEQAGEMGLDEIVRTEESETAFWTELQAMIGWLSIFSSIVCWIPFNEGWGQFQTMRVVHWLREFGHGRWVNTASGWNDVADLFPGRDAGDIVDVHNYEGPPFQRLNGTFLNWPLPHAGRALVLGEYGGLGLSWESHEWAPESSWAYGEVSHTSDDLAQALESLASRLAGLMCESRLSASVYTQWTDIETEVNGLLTYDRIPKVPIERLQAVASILFQAHATCYPAAPGANSEDALGAVMSVHEG